MNPIESLSKKLSELINIYDHQIGYLIQQSLSDNDIYGYIVFYRETSDEYIKHMALSLLLNAVKEFLEKKISEIYDEKFTVNVSDYSELDDSFDIIKMKVEAIFYIGNIEAKTIIIKNEIEASIEKELI